MEIFKRELDRSKIDKEELISWIYGSKENYFNYINFSKKMDKIFPFENHIKFYDLNRKDKYEMGQKVSAALLENGYYEWFNNEKIPLESTSIFSFEILSGVSQMMVNPLLELLGTEKQKEKWLTLLKKGYIVGAYAQTELAHGSDVQNLKTTATLDWEKNEFILNSPTIDSIKFWPGELAQSSCIAVVYAQLIIKNKKRGVFPFVVEIRDIESHKILPNIELGNIGPKFGFESKDNGFLKLNNVRIPKENILNKFVEIKNDGTLIKNGNDRIIYASMMKLRTFILLFSYFNMAKVLTISLRYSLVRKQFKDSQGKEIPIINYQLQKYKLYRHLSQTYAILFNYRYMKVFVENLQEEVKSNNFDSLQEAHILLSGTKAFYTQWCLETCEMCVTACGGHGFSHYSGIPYLVQKSFAYCILEGENYMLSLQVSKYLLKLFKNFHKGLKIKGNFKFITKFKDLKKFELKETLEDLKNPNSLKIIFEKLLINSIENIAEKLKIAKNNKRNLKEELDKSLGIKLFTCSKIFNIYFTYVNFVDGINVKCSNLKEALFNLSLLFIYDQIIINSSVFMEFDVINNNHMKIIKKEYENLLEIIDIDMYALIDSFKVTDRSLYSAIGMSDEKPYENLYNWAKNYNELNKVEFQFNNLKEASIKRFGKPKL